MATAYTDPPTPARSGAHTGAACDGRPSVAATDTREPSRPYQRPAPSDLTRYRRRPEIVHAYRYTGPVGVAVATDARGVDPGDWMVCDALGRLVAVMSDAEFRAVYIEDGTS